MTKMGYCYPNQISNVSVPLIGDFVFNYKYMKDIKEAGIVSVPLIGDFVFNDGGAKRGGQTEMKKFPSP